MRRICVIDNPTAGRKRSGDRLRPFRERWPQADFWPTQAAGHAAELARQAVEQGYEIIAAAGGDGTVHEVAGELLGSGAEDITFAVVPVGSANDYAFSIARQFGEAELDDAAGDLVDVGLLKTGDGRSCYFIESVGIGLTGEITAESRLIPNRQGLWLYGTAALRVLWRREPPLPLKLTWDDAPAIAANTRLLSVLIGQREGNFLMAKEASLNDGLFDVVHGKDVSHWEALRLLPRFLLSGPPADHPRIDLRRCRRLSIESEQPLTIHTDGEVFSTRTDNVRNVVVETVPSRLRVKVCRL